MVKPYEKGNKKGHPRHVENFVFPAEGKQIELAICGHYDLQNKKYKALDLITHWDLIKAK